MRQTDKTYILKYDPLDPAIRKAVESLKDRIANAVTLHPPDYSKPFFLFVDGAQTHGVGSCICQFLDTGPPGSEEKSSGRKEMPKWDREATAIGA